MQRSPQYYDLIDSFSKPGCGVCRLLKRDAARYLESLLYEYVNDRDVQKRFIEARGLCNTHSWQMTGSKGYALGIAILQANLLRDLDALNLGSPRPGLSLRRNKVSDPLEPQAPCLVCARMDETEPLYLNVMAAFLDDDRFMTAFRSSSGLCLPHVRQMRHVLEKSPALTSFMVVQRGVWDRLRAELDEFARKSDAYSQSEAFGEEADSWLRAIEALAGLDDVFGMRRGGARSL
ncbi:MAG: DUF6062 family protein [bacterium]|nr:DUF6062 family protein [bacterium]